MITKRKRKWGWAGWTGKPNARAELGQGRTGSGNMLRAAHLCRRGRLACGAGLGVGTAEEPGGNPGSQGMEDTAGPRGRGMCCQMHPFLSPNRWQPCDSLKSCISQPPLQILMAPQQMECGKKRLGGASGEDLFPRKAELALPFPPSPGLEADVTAGAATAIL